MQLGYHIAKKLSFKSQHSFTKTITSLAIAAVSISICVVILAFGIYGMTLGFWRDPKMGIFVGIKMPALILLTLICNGFLNGMLGLLLGSGLGFRQSIMAQLMSFTIAALVLGGLAPVTFFMSLNAPAPDAEEATETSGHTPAARRSSRRLTCGFVGYWLARRRAPSAC